MVRAAGITAFFHPSGGSLRDDCAYFQQMTGDGAGIEHSCMFGPPEGTIPEGQTDVKEQGLRKTEVWRACAGRRISGGEGSLGRKKTKAKVGVGPFIRLAFGILFAFQPHASRHPACLFFTRAA